MRRAIVVGVFFVCMMIGPSLCRAQVPITSSCGAGAPISLSNTSESTSAGAITPSVLVTNVGTRPVTAVFIRWRYTDQQNKAVDTIASVDYAVSGSPMKPGDSLVMRGDKVKETTQFPVKEISVSCEAALFQGFGLWGNPTLPAIHDLRQVRIGYKMERGRLLNAYKQGGVPQLLKELNIPITE